jgi:hypothetical protein
MDQCKGICLNRDVFFTAGLNCAKEGKADNNKRNIETGK